MRCAFASCALSRDTDWFFACETNHSLWPLATGDAEEGEKFHPHSKVWMAPCAVQCTHFRGKSSRNDLLALPFVFQGARKRQEPFFCPAAWTLSAALQGIEYCYVTVQDTGRSAADVLAEELPKLLKSLSFSKTMRWHPHSDAAFSRPLRWLVALHGATVVPFVAGGVPSGRTVQLMRGAQPREAVLRAAEDYAGAMEVAGIVEDVETRRELIWRNVLSAAEVRL